MYALSLKQISIKYTKKEMFIVIVGGGGRHIENKENNWILKLNKTLQSVWSWDVRLCKSVRGNSQWNFTLTGLKRVGNCEVHKNYDCDS